MATVIANLMVTDVQKSVEFYRDVLGLEVATRVPAEGEVLGDSQPDQPLIFATLRLGDGELMLQSVESFTAEAPGVDPDDTPKGTLSIYMRVEDVDTLADALGGSLIKEAKVSWYGMKEIWALDPDGYLLTLGQPEGPPPE